LLGPNCVRLTICGVGITQPAESLDDLRQNLKEELSVRVDEEHLLPGFAAAGDLSRGESRSREVESADSRAASCRRRQPSIPKRVSHASILASRMRD
jgi:hypothetical protein